MVHPEPMAQWEILPLLRIPGHQRAKEPEASALPLPGLPQGLLSQDENIDAWIQAPSEHLGHCLFLVQHPSQGCVEHEAPP